MTTEQRLQALEDRIAIRDLIDAYAYCADTRDSQGQMALFTINTNFEVYMDERIPTPTQVITGRDNLLPVFADLNKYLSTMHFNGQSTITLNGDHATGITYCRAFHLTVSAETRQPSTPDTLRQPNTPASTQHLMVAGIRYFDTMIRQNGAWLFAQRQLKVCWIENR